jgi:hypothetical protein
MDLIYKIYSVYLYDNQLNHDYLILYNRYYDYRGLTWDLSYEFSDVFEKIYSVTFMNENIKVSHIDIDSTGMMKNVCCKKGLPFIKNDGFLTLVKNGTTHLTNYNIYDIYWNETKSGVNIHQYDVCAAWNVNKSTYSPYRIWEEKDERAKALRDIKISEIFV